MTVTVYFYSRIRLIMLSHVILLSSSNSTIDSSKYKMYHENCSQVNKGKFNTSLICSAAQFLSMPRKFNDLTLSKITVVFQHGGQRTNKTWINDMEFP